MIRHEKGRRDILRVADILKKNVLNNEWLRMDMVVRYLAIEEYYGKNDYGWNLYSKMQDRRVGEGYAKESIAKYRALLESIEKQNYDLTSYITLDKNYSLIDGSHRLALSLYYGIEEIPVLILNTEEVSYYTINWFIKNGFTEAEIDIICKKKDEISKGCGLIAE
jgi:hypothetical protein